MLVKSQYNLQPSVFESHSVIIENSAGQIIYVAVELEGGTIIAAQAGDRDFEAILAGLNVAKTGIVHTLNPRPVEEMKKLF